VGTSWIGDINLPAEMKILNSFSLLEIPDLPLHKLKRQKKFVSDASLKILA
jgi:hypothetical protein